MKAAVLFQTGKPLRILEDVEAPPPARGQVFVALSHAGVCHSQVMEVRGGRGIDPYLPHLLGHEGVGTVLAVGEGVTRVAPGDRVVLGWIKGQGLDADPIRYRWRGLDLNAGAVTTFNTHALIAENRCQRLPEGVPDEIGVLLGCAAPTGAGIVTNELKPAPGASAAVFGLGGIGLTALMALVAAGCDPIIAVDIAPAKLQAALDCGATHVIDANREDPVTAIRSLTSGRGVDCAVEAAGRVQTIEQAFESTRKFGGQCVFASHPPAGQKISVDPHDLISGKGLKGTWGGASVPDRDVALFARMYLDGKLPLERLLSNRYDLEEINQAIDDLGSGSAFRPLIRL